MSSKSSTLLLLHIVAVFFCATSQLFQSVGFVNPNSRLPVECNCCLILRVRGVWNFGSRSLYRYIFFFLTSYFVRFFPLALMSE